MNISKRTKTLDRIFGMRADMCWQLEPLSAAIGALSFHESEHVPTMAVNARGRCYVNPAFAAELPDNELRFVILHEAFHPMLRHQERRMDRDPRLWNCAADLAINAVLSALQVRGQADYLKLARGGLHPATHTPGAPPFASAEEYYAWITQHSEARENVEKARGDGTPKIGAGCGVSGEDGEGEDAEGEGGEPGEGNGTGGPGEGLSPAQWRLVAQVVRDEAQRHSAGSAALGALAGLLEIPPPRVKWGALLRREASQALAQAGHDDVSWSRRSRRSNGTYTLPGSVVTKARIAVVIDASGSVDDKSLGRAVSETASAVDASGVPAFLVIHDAAVHFAGWIHPGVRGRTVASYVRGRGGTLFHPAYEAIGELREKFGSLVHFTDGVPCEPWPELPKNCRRGIAALVGYADKSHIPEGHWRAIAVDVK